MLFSQKYISFFLFFSVFFLFLFLLSPLFIKDTNPLNAPGKIFLTDRNGEVITDKALSGGYKKESEIELESELVEAFIFIEDKSYFSHFGVNIPAKFRALRDNISGKKDSGGSTIVEQYIKNTYFQDIQRSYFQKLREATISAYISFPYTPSPLVGAISKKEKKYLILKKYLSQVYFGNQLYGLGAAMEVYFGKSDIRELTHEEIVILISLLHNPGIQNLEEVYFQSYFEQVKKRLGYTFERSYFGTLPRKENIDIFPHVTLKWLEGELGYPSQETTIDASLMRFSQNIIEQTLDGLKDKNVTNAAIYGLDPKSGEVRIYIGSKDFYAEDIDGQVDVIESQRQVGSTLKPFLYLLALKIGAYPDDLILDIDREYESFQEGKVYISENYSLKEYGLVRLKKALGNSFNNASVRLARELGLEQVYEYYKKFGLKLPYPAEYYGYSIVLGNPSITLKNLVESYIQLGDLEDPEKFLLYDILTDPDNRDVSFGVNSILSASIPQAVKTGTSSNFRDNLTVSYHPDMILGVWVGNNDNSSMQGVTGITGAAYIWRQVIEKSIELGYIKNTIVPVPKGISQISYCLDSSCFRRENIFVKGDKKYYSGISEGIYDSRDIYEVLSNEELEKLRSLGFSIQK